MKPTSIPIALFLTALLGSPRAMATQHADAATPAKTVLDASKPVAQPSFTGDSRLASGPFCIARRCIDRLIDADKKPKSSVPAADAPAPQLAGGLPLCVANRCPK